VVTLVGLLLVAGLVFYAIAPEARDRLLRVVVGSIGLARQEARRVRPECERFRTALRERTPRAVATPVLVALNLVVFVCMLFGAGALADAETLVGWGGNSWLHTRNGEWWRLITAIFVHAGLLHLFVNIAGFVQISLILERLVGPAILVAVFLIAGVFGNLVNLMAHPMATSVGASGAAYGLYGLLFASSIWGLRHPSSVTIPLTVIKQLSPAASVFFLYNLVTDSVGSTGELTALVVGLVCGGVLTREVSEHKPASRRVAHAMAAALVVSWTSGRSSSGHSRPRTVPQTPIGKRPVASRADR
jgi:rhomboid protease GluP